ELRDAFCAHARHAGETNRALVAELAGIVEILEKAGGAPLILPNPLLTPAPDSEFGLRAVDALEVLVPEDRLAASLRTLREFGYERDRRLSDARLDLLHRLQGHEPLTNAYGVRLALRTRLAPIDMVLDIDYPGLWERAARVVVRGHTMTVPSAEDGLLALAILGAGELWRRV